MYQAQGNYAKAERLSRQALDVYKKVQGAKHPAYATSLDSLAALYDAEGNYAKAEPLYRQALNLRKEVLGEKHPHYATSLNNLALLYQAQDNHAKAEPLHRQALELRKEVLGAKHPDYAQSLNNLALLYEAQGNHAKAEPLYRHALELRKEVLGEKHPAYATSLNNLALLYNAQGDDAKAEPLYRQALDIKKEVLGAKHPHYARGLNNLAFLYNAQGNHAKAEPLFRQALDLQKEVLGEKHPDYATSLNNLALLYHAQGKHAKAEPLFRQALSAAQVTKDLVALDKLQANDLRVHADTVLLLHNRGLYLQATAAGVSGKTLRSGEHMFALALAVLERVRQENIHEQQSKIDLAAKRFSLFPDRIGILHQLFALEKKAADLEAAFHTAEQGTGRGFLESMGQNRANQLAGVSSALQDRESQLLQDLRQLDFRLDKESKRPPDQRDPDLVGQLIGERRDAEAKLKELVAQMEKENPSYAGLKYPRPCTVEQARACLATNEVALLFVPGPKDSFVVLVEGSPRTGDEANGLAIIKVASENVLAEHVAALTDPDVLTRPARVRVLAQEAYETILGPCKDRIKGKNLVIVPGGPLGLLPFELLVDDDGKYLVESHRIRYAPSLTALHLIKLWKEKRSAPKMPLFAVGDPNYDQVAAQGRVNVARRGNDVLSDLAWREGREEGFKRLIHSGYEVAQIAELLGAKKEYVLTGDVATEAKVKDAKDRLAQARYVHFATHGILGLDKGKQPALVLGQTNGQSEDGLLELNEIANLKLNADLVVLSACRTGQGRLQRGEGVSGLARMFIYAGTKGVVCSLWSVDDRETANLMVSMYRHLQKEQPAADALRAAQLEMIQAGKGPLYWAPFILIGE